MAATDVRHGAERGKRARFGPAFDWLLGHGVGSARIAGIFGTTAANVRVIAHRAQHRHSDVVVPDELSSLLVEPTSPLRQTLGLQPYPDHVVTSKSRRRAMDELEHDLETSVADAIERQAFAEGPAALDRLRPRFGRPASARLMQLLARWHQHQAWFLSHEGRSPEAVTMARQAIRLYSLAYRESEDRTNLKLVAEAALIGSNSLLMWRKPEAARRLLLMAQDAAGRVGIELGSEHAAQQGKVMLQTMDEESALKLFDEATRRMLRLGEGGDRPLLLLSGVRRANFLRRDWDRAQETLKLASQSFSHSSVDYSVNLHWTVATALAVGSPSALLAGLEALEHRIAVPGYLERETTVLDLLAATPALGLHRGLLRAWLRWLI